MSSTELYYHQHRQSQSGSEPVCLSLDHSKIVLPLSNTLTLPNLDQMVSSTPMGLLSLPQEIINAILTEIGDSIMTYRSLARVCRTFNALANPFVYESVIIRQPSTGEKFAEAMTNAPHLNPLVHKLQIHLHGTEDDVPFNVPEDFDSVLPKLVNLESLVIKSDYFDNEPDDNIFSRPGVLPALRSCKLLNPSRSPPHNICIMHYAYVYVYVTLLSTRSNPL